MKLPKFNQRPAHTLLFITEVKTFRVDADRKGVLLNDVEVIEYGCKAPNNLAKAFTKIAENTAELGSKVWLLFLRLSGLHISVPTMQVRGVDQATLTQALQFEAEGITGVSSMDTQVAFHFLKAENEMSDYWLVQIEQLAWEDLLKVFKEKKLKLAGLLHPGMLPMAITDNTAREWRRIESWSTQILAMQYSDAQLSVVALSFENSHWHAELEQWLHDVEPVEMTETLINNRVELLPVTEQSYMLNDHGQLTDWLGLWSQTLIERRSKEVAVLKPPSKVNADVVWMMSTGMTALLLCALHAGWFIHQQTHYDAETQRLRRIEKDMTALRKQITDSNDQKDKLQLKLLKITSNADLIPNTISKLQQRSALLLLALAEGRHQQVIIESLESEMNQVIIGGVTLQHHLGNQLAEYLADALKDLHWEVGSPAKSNMALFADEPGPWSFKLKLTDTGIPGFSDPRKN